MDEFDSLSVRIRHPSNIIVNGSTGTGKTWFVRTFLTEYLLQTTIKKQEIKVLWCYAVQESLLSIENVNVSIQYFKGIPKENDIRDVMPDVIVFDDLMVELASGTKANKQEYALYFSRLGHHLQFSIIVITQHMFEKQFTLIRENCKYAVFMKSPRAQQQIEIFCKQNGLNKEIVIEAYRIATPKPYSYLLIDLHPEQDEKLSLRTRIFHSELSPELQKLLTVAPIVLSSQ